MVMARDARRRSPRFDALEGRQLLSTTAQATPSAFLTSDSQDTTHAAGGREVLRTTFSGTANNVGPAQATSTEVARNGGLVSVQVQLQTAHGSVRLAFGPKDVTQNIASTYGTEIAATYHVVAGTGAFAHQRGTAGTVAFWTLGGDNGWNLTITPNATGTAAAGSTATSSG
jgi:hypothetical protein